jgi:hypothetical protein
MRCRPRPGESLADRHRRPTTSDRIARRYGTGGTPKPPELTQGWDRCGDALAGPEMPVSGVIGTSETGIRQRVVHRIMSSGRKVSTRIPNYEG